MVAHECFLAGLVLTCVRKCFLETYRFTCSRSLFGKFGLSKAYLGISSISQPVYLLRSAQSMSKKAPNKHKYSWLLDGSDLPCGHIKRQGQPFRWKVVRLMTEFLRPIPSSFQLIVHAGGDEVSVVKDRAACREQVCHPPGKGRSGCGDN